MDKHLKDIDVLFNKALALATIIRDHVATMIVVTQYIQTSIENGYESAIITRLENHKKVLNELVKKDEYIHQEPTSMGRLILTTSALCRECNRVVIQANKLCNENTTLQRALQSITNATQDQTLTESIKNMPGLSKALKIQQDVVRWHHINETTTKALRECYNTCVYIHDTCIATDNNNSATLYQTLWSPAELLKQITEGDTNAENNTAGQPNAAKNAE